jgi:hypothetical protein
MRQNGERKPKYSVSLSSRYITVAAAPTPIRSFGSTSPMLSSSPVGCVFFCTVDGVEGVCSHGGRVRERHTRSRRRTPPAAACIPPTLHAGRLWPSALRAPADCLRPLLLSSSALPRPSAATIDPASSSCLRAHRPPRP